MPVTVVFDGQAGSCGKGKLIGTIACLNHAFGIPMSAIDNFMSNAGHTYVTADGTPIMTQHLPTSMINPDARLYIGPGAAISPRLLAEEIVRYGTILGRRKVTINPRAVVIEQRHINREKEIIKSGTTFKGCGAAQADKIMRVPGTWLMGSDDVLHSLLVYDNVHEHIDVRDHTYDLHNDIGCDYSVIVEGSQGLDLDINYGLPYPHVTSRQCNVSQLVADCGISPFDVNNAVMLIRPYPIRISSQTEFGTISSGDYEGSREITWDDVKIRCGAPADVQFGEMTTVTKRMRRVFEMNWERLNYAVMVNKPTGIFINFAQYLDWSIYQESNYDEFVRGYLTFGTDVDPYISVVNLPTAVQKFIDCVERETGVPVIGIGTGARVQDVIFFNEAYDLFRYAYHGDRIENT